MPELKGRDSMKVKRLAGTFNYGDINPLPENSPMKGKSYFRYRYLDKVFVVNTEDPFNEDFNEGKVYSIDLTADEDGQLSFAGHTNIGQEVNMKKTEVMLESITVENFKVTQKDYEAVA
jgi:hypothetical protein